MIDDPSLTVAIALIAGVLCQALAHHLRLPSIVLLLVSGVLLGPDVGNLVRPESLGSGLNSLVGFAVAIILFEGGLRLRLGRLRREQVVIRRLVTIGALLSGALSAMAAYWILHWPFRLCVLFGTLVIVTGPTVVTPLLQRLQVQRRVSVVLEAEGVLIDAVGAITAAVALEVALRPSGEGIVLAAPQVLARLGFGTVVGAVGGFALSMALRLAGAIPSSLRNIFALSSVVITYEIANLVMHESGLASAIAMGLVVANTSQRALRGLEHFKEQITLLLIGMLFVLLAADVRLSDVMGLGMGGVLTVVALIVIVRPIVVALCSIGTDLSLRERTLIAWIAPRGVVAAAVASLFAVELERAQLDGGAELRALVFATIAATVLWSGLTGGLVAKWLGLKKKSDSGWIILGAGPLAIELGRLLEDEDEVICVDQDPHRVRSAQEANLRALHANPMDARTLRRAELQSRVGVIGATSVPSSNLLFALRARNHAPEHRFAVGVTSDNIGATTQLVTAEGLEVLFGAATDLQAWNSRIESGRAMLVWCEVVRAKPTALRDVEDNRSLFVPLVHDDRRGVAPYTDRSRLKSGDKIALLTAAGSEERLQDAIKVVGYKLLNETACCPVGGRGVRSSTPPYS